MNVHPREDLAALAIGALDRDEARRLREHVDRCAACRAELASFDEVAWGLGELAPGIEVRADVRERIVAKAARPTRDTGPRKALPRPLGSLLGIRVPMAVPLALALVLALSLAALQSVRTDALSFERAIAGVAGGTVVTLAPTPGSDARGVLVVPDDGGRPYLILRLAAPPPDKTWEAWVIRSQVPIPAGISGERSGVVTLLLSQAVMPGDAVAVTLEDSGGVPEPRGPVVLQARR